MADPLLQYVPKLIYSGILLFLAGIFLLEVMRVWTDTRLYLAPFDYERDGKVQQEAGVNFARRVSQSLRRVKFIYTGGGASGSPIASTDQIDRAINLELPDVRTTGIESVEVQAYGVNFGTLLRSVRGWVHERNQIVGFVSHYGSTIDVQASIQGSIVRRVDPSLGTGLNLGWALRESDVGEATFELVCGIFRMLAASQSDVFRTITDRDFCQFLRALETYQEYRRLLARNIPKQDKEKLLTQARELVQPLEGARFPFASKLAGLIYRESEELDKAEVALLGYLSLLEELNQSDRQIAQLLADIRKATSTMVAQAAPSSRPGASPGAAFDGKARRRPLTVGLSISSTEASAGTLCCFVEDAQGKRYALTADHVVPGAIGAPVMQPGRFDGGALPQDVIGKVALIVTGVESNGLAAGALIELADDQEFDTAIPGRDGAKLAGMAENVAEGAQIYLVGRTSGIATGRVEGVDESITLAVERSKTVTFRGLIRTSRITQGGDSGAPVLNDQNQLIGLAYAGGEVGSFIMPIKPLLQALKVTLATP